MDIAVKVFSTLVALEFLFIMYLETFATESAQTGKTFSMDKSDLQHPKVKLLLKNQGVYNGLIALVIFYATFISANMHEILVGAMLYIILVALYGAFSSGKASIFFKQGTLAVITLVLLLIA